MNKIQKKIHKLASMNLAWFKRTNCKFSYRQHRLIWRREFKHKKYTNEYIVKTSTEKLWEDFVED